MAQITAAMVKELRDRTGVGMTKCKEALQTADGDMEQAIVQLRKAGMATAVKKEGREANEGLIATAENGDSIVIVEVNAETDFVAQNENFRQFLKNIAEEIIATKPASLEEFLQQNYSGDPAMTIEQYRASIVQSIGENIVIKRFELIEKQPNRSYGVYSHMGGKIVAMVELEGADDQQDAAKQVAMHIAAEAPDYINSSEVPAEIVEKEKEIARSQVSNKPDHIIEKIIEGKVNAFYDKICLLNQSFIKDSSLSVAEFVEQQAKEAGKPLAIKHMLRWNIG
ncbi:MAG: translation elongation factor Ts [Chlamydiota bacterium]